MTTVDKISQQAYELPEPIQKEVLDFIKFLQNKIKREIARQEDLEWFNLSLKSAMREIADEDGPTYNESDLKERWR